MNTKNMTALEISEMVKSGKLKSQTYNSITAYIIAMEAAE